MTPPDRPLAAQRQRLRRVARYGPRIALRLAAHRGRQWVARVAFRIALARGDEGLRFLRSGATRVDFAPPPPPRLRVALARLAELVYCGAHPVGSEAWLDLETGAVFCPLWPKEDALPGPSARLRCSPTQDLCDGIACPPFAGDRKIPQDVGRLADLWLLVAADAAPPAASAPLPARARQARFFEYLSAFFARAGSPSHAFWSCPMDTGIGATNLLFASEHFVALDPGSPEAAELRRLRDRFCALALRYITLVDERTPVLNNNHHLLNRISAALLTGLCDRPERFAPALAALDRELANHFDDDGLLREGSTSYHAFVHSALGFAADVLCAYHPDDVDVASLREKVRRLADVRRQFAAGGELLLLGDADGAVYGPEVALTLGATPAGYERIALVRRVLGAPGEFRAHRTPDSVVVVGRVDEIAPAQAPTSARVSTRSHRRRGWTWVTTRLRPASSARVPAWNVDHLEGFGALLVTVGALRVVVRTRPRARATGLGHFHLDLGAVYLGCADGWLRADPGVLTYTGDPAVRATLRAAKAHPTVIPDERQFIRPTGLFSAESVPVSERIERTPGRVTVLHALSGDDYYVRVSAAPDGGVIVRQGTPSPRHNVPFPLSPPVSNYGYDA